MGIFGVLFALVTGTAKVVDYYRGVGITTENRIHSAQHGNLTYFDSHGQERYCKTNEPVFHSTGINGEDECLINSKTGAVVYNYSRERRENIHLSPYELENKEKAIQIGALYYSCSTPYKASTDYKLLKKGTLPQAIEYNFIRSVKDDSPHFSFYFHERIEISEANLCLFTQDNIEHSINWLPNFGREDHYYCSFFYQGIVNVDKFKIEEVIPVGKGTLNYFPRTFVSPEEEKLSSLVQKKCIDYIYKKEEESWSNYRKHININRATIFPLDLCKGTELEKEVIG